ncbi:class I SAM-dependent methyltransferase [Nocardioides jensenii]|uniref:class I SAM-dependent methyltransferase n=1 Tax=Nocardioides jensenii TaxID=1843 RepID=UPI00082EE6F9|nr:class I SAM-dependent methyltransferase [Nocardioides jensenii]
MDNSKNPLETYFRNNSDGRLIHKWLHYFEIYHRHFERFRGRKPVVLEFGVSQGGSLEMWRDYFGRGAKIHGVDINPKCKELERRRSKIFIGDQADREFLRSIVDEIGPVDVVIEDGGHQFDQQIHTFEEIYPTMAEDGVFLIEDLHTSYWPKNFGGGVRKPGTFIEYAKNLSDQLNAWHSRQPRKFQVDEFTRTTKSMHFYDSIIAFERGSVVRPTHERVGIKTVHDPDWKAARTPVGRVANRLLNR